MRWQWVDKVDSMVPWQAAAGRKAVSLEEYCIALPLGREGEFPESLVLECCVALTRWLVEASSDFRMTCVLDEVAQFAFTGPAGMGDVLALEIAVTGRDERSLAADCRVRAGGREIARGRIAVSFIPLAEVGDAEWRAGTWKELYASA